MNAADYYGLEQLRKACTGFVQCCITVDTVCALLASAERYIQYKCTKSLVHKVRLYRNLQIFENVLCKLTFSRLRKRMNSFYRIKVLISSYFALKGIRIRRRTWQRSVEFRILHATSPTCGSLDPGKRRVTSRWIHQVSSTRIFDIIFILLNQEIPYSLLIFVCLLFPRKYNSFPFLIS